MSRGEVPEQDGLRAMVHTAFAETAGSLAYFHGPLLVKMPGRDEEARQQCALLLRSPDRCRESVLHHVVHADCWMAVSGSCAHSALLVCLAMAARALPPMCSLGLHLRHY